MKNANQNRKKQHNMRFKKNKKVKERNQKRRFINHSRQ